MTVRRIPLTIGEWRVDPATNELARGRASVRIEPRAMDVLMLLAERAGTVVSRDELFAAAWPGVVVGDEALNQSIAKLRRALGDDSQSPAYIETIAKRGYRLKAPVRPAEIEGVRPAELEGVRPAELQGMRPADPQALPPPRVRRPRMRWIAGTGVALFFAIIAIARFGFAPNPAAPPRPAAAAKDGAITVTVLPFESSSTGGDGYFARGIGDDLVTHLGTLHGLRLITAEGSRTGRYVVSGSVQRDAGRVRANVHLADSQSGELIWSERFERRADDLFAFQDEIAVRVATALPAKVGDAERARLAKRYTVSLEAYEQFLRAQPRFLARDWRDNLEARALYRRAIEIDPAFARAYAGLAMTYAIDPRLRGGASASDAVDRAQQLAETARQIDPDIAEVHWALGFVHAQRRQHAEAIADLERAIAINPSFADAYALMGGVRTYTGEPAKALALLHEALRLNPAGGYLYYLLLGRAYFFEGDLEQALMHLRAAVERNPADLETRVYLAAAASAAGDRAAAEWEAQEVRALEPGFAARDWLERYPLGSAPHRARLERELRTLGL